MNITHFSESLRQYISFFVLSTQKKLGLEISKYEQLTVRFTSLGGDYMFTKHVHKY